MVSSLGLYIKPFDGGSDDFEVETRNIIHQNIYPKPESLGRMDYYTVMPKNISKDATLPGLFSHNTRKAFKKAVAYIHEGATGTFTMFTKGHSQFTIVKRTWGVLLAASLALIEDKVSSTLKPSTNA